MGKQSGGNKLRRCNKKASSYAAQFFRTARNKKHQAQRRRDKTALWAIKKAEAAATVIVPGTP